MITTVVPPPGVSSISTVAPMASTNPRVDGETQPDAAAAVAVAEPLEGLEDPFPVGAGDAGAPVDDAQIDAVGERPRLDPDPLPAGREARRRCR